MTLPRNGLSATHRLSFVELSRAEAERQLALFEASSDDDSVDDRDGARAQVGPLQGPAAPATANLPPRLPTPSPSTVETPDSRGVILPGDPPSVATPDITVNKATQGRKRRRDAHAEEEEEGRPAKMRKTDDGGAPDQTYAKFLDALERQRLCWAV